MRLFFALELPPPPREHLVRVQERLRPLLPRVSWTKGQNLHLTLKFLGEVDEARVPPVVEAARACPMKPVLLRPAGLSLLPPGRAFRVLAVALVEDEDLRTLHACLEERLETVGFERDRRPYHPHITLARARNPISTSMRATLVDAITSLADPGPATVTGFALVQSRLHPTGPCYTAIQRFA
jgi:RNA 2',3'-cyclic 3'-phosphodiesterase